MCLLYSTCGGERPSALLCVVPACSRESKPQPYPSARQRRWGVRNGGGGGGVGGGGLANHNKRYVQM